MLTASSKSLSSRDRQMTPIAPIGFCILLMQIGQIEALLQFNPTTSAHELRIPHSSPSRLRTSQWAEVDKGFNLLEIASQVVPQGQIVQTAKETVKFAWKRMMTELAPQDKTGSYQRPKYSFARTIGSKQFPIEAGRYHVYVGNPCPWCHRVRLATKLLKLDTIKGKNGKPLLELTTLVDDPIKASRGGWVFATPPSQLPEVKDLRGLYDALSPGFQGRCTAPILVDWKTRQIISNESSDIVRMLPLLLAAQKESANADVALDLYPSDLASKIDETNEWIYRLLNNGVYRCGFSTTQEAYQKASKDVLEGLERADTILQNQDFINGSKLTESDLLLLPTMLRFDGVYSPLFGAGGKHLRLQCDYPAIFAWLKKCWLLEGVRESIDIEDACSSYYRQLFPLNPGGILPTPVSAKSLRLED